MPGNPWHWGLGPRAASKKTKRVGARIAGLKATESVCPYCAVGCGQVVYTRGGELVDVEGHPRSPVNQGTLCPKGSATRQLVQQPRRALTVKYRAPYATEWQELELETAMDMIAERVIAAREAGWQDVNDEGWRVDRTLGFATSAARRSTTRRTTSSRRPSRPWARSRSRTRRAYDTPPPSPVWGPPSGAAAPPTRRAPSRTPTAS